MADQNENLVHERPSNFGPGAGTYLGHQIYEWVDLEDGRYAYQGIAPGPKPGVVDMDAIGDDEICLTPGLLYRRVPT